MVIHCCAVEALLFIMKRNTISVLGEEIKVISH